MQCLEVNRAVVESVELGLQRALFVKTCGYEPQQRLRLTDGRRWVDVLVTHVQWVTESTTGLAAQRCVISVERLTSGAHARAA